MKKIIFLYTVFLTFSTHAIVKTFINDSKKTFLIRIYNDQKEIMDTNLAPGAVQDVFLTNSVINKIIIQDDKHKDYPLSSMAYTILKKESRNLNDSDIFIIHADASVRIYARSTNRDAMLQEIDKIYSKQYKLPTIAMKIENGKYDDKVNKQQVSYVVIAE